MRRALWTIVIAALITGCHRDEPPYDPLDYLAVGVELNAEAVAEERALRQRGFAIVSRVDGRGFVALGARSPRGGGSSVRILTSRGIAMGVDAPVREHPTWRSVALLERASGRDLDGDEDVEVLVSVDDSMRPAPCLVVVRIRERGDAFEVPLDARAYGPRACPEDVVDLHRDGHVQLLVGHRPWVVIGAPVPVVPVAFEGHDGAWAEGSAGLARELAEAVVADRVEAFVQTKARGEIGESVRLALEIYWLDGSRGMSEGERGAALDARLGGLVIEGPLAQLVELARRGS